ncbi:MAG TPA: hypothetical protein EYO58_09920 [Flavobacteriales bacterium]|nr:hypothetical protein [Flavobacteriales bacterium]
MDAVSNLRLTESDSMTTTCIVDQQWLGKLRSDVGVIGSSTTTLNEYCLRLFLAITDKDKTNVWLNPNTTIDVNQDTTLKQELYVDHEEELFNTFGPLLITLYIQLGKTRICPFTEQVETQSPKEVFDDIRNALDTQMELLEHITLNALHTSHPTYAEKSIYKKSFFQSWKDDANQDKIVFCWRTFKNVFGVPQLHPWKREVDPTTCARELKETLLLDILPVDADIEVSVLMEVIDILRNRAYDNLDDANADNASPSLVHLLRLVLWNLGVWDISVDDPDYLQYVKTHLNQLIKHGQHPFQEVLTIEDVVYGHTSPLLIARMFVLCARYHAMSNKHRKELLSTFKTAYDSAVTKIRHPVFLAMFLKFRGHFLQVPNIHYLHKLWHMIDIGLWQQNNMLWEHLLEYAMAIEFIGNPLLYAHKNYFEELDYILDIAHQVDDMSNDDIAKVRRKLQEHFVDKPKQESAEEVEALRNTRKQRLERDAV